MDAEANDRWPLRVPITIRTFDIDFAGVVSNIVYVQWLEIARTQLLEEVDLPIPRIVEDGVAPVVARTEVEYKRPLRLGEPVEVRLALDRLRAISAQLVFEVATGDEVAATARQLALFVSTSTGRPHRLPRDLRDRFERYVRADDADDG